MGQQNDSQAAVELVVEPASQEEQPLEGLEKREEQAILFLDPEVSYLPLQYSN